jgi:hypothetical protein
MDSFPYYINAISNHNPLIYAAKPPINPDEIKTKYSNLQIPEEYIQFLAINNGVVLGEFQLFSPDKIEENMIEMKNTYGEYWDERLVPFASHKGVGDYLSFRIKEENGTKEYEIFDCFHELPPSDWKCIEKIFTIWLEKFVQSNFEPYWLNWKK